MKTLFAFLAALVLVAAVERPAQAATATVSVDFFYDSLAPYGDWVEVEGYGYCFRPAISLTDPDWRPYTEGSWIYTDAGWTWDSREDFGWATYHYGRWLMVGNTWFWVPGDVWGPAWVSWRADDEIVGWAPLPPEAIWTPDVGFSVYVDVHYDIGPACYTFIPVHHLGANQLRRYIEPWHRNIDYMRHTENCTRITHRSTSNFITAIFNEGPEFARYSRRTDSPIRRMNLAVHDGADFRDPKKRFRNWSENDRLRVIAPSVSLAASGDKDRKSAPDHIRQHYDRSQVNRGWQGFREEEVREVRSKMQTAATNGKPREESKRTIPADDRPPSAIPVNPERATVDRDSKTRPGARSPDRTSILGDESSNAERSTDRIRPPSSKEEQRKAIPVIPEQDRDQRTRVRPEQKAPKVAPRQEPPRSAPPPEIKKRDDGDKPDDKPRGEKKSDDDDDKRKKPR